EPPALRISETPNRRFSDKIVQLHNSGAALTAAEQANFREIAKRLEAFGASKDEPAVPAPMETAVTETAGFEKASGPEEFEAETPIAEKAETLSLEEMAAQEAIFENAVEAQSEDDGATEEPSIIAEDEATEGLEETVSQIEVLTSFIPPRVKMTDGLSVGTVDQLPVAVLIHIGDALIHANPEFMRLTGYDSIEALREVGGIEALLQRRELEEKSVGSGTMMLVKADDTLAPVTARLQSVRWEDANALMLALMPVEGKEDGRGEANRSEGRSEGRPERMVEKVAKLQVEVEELRSILETATDGVVVIGTEGDIRSMNRSASALFNYDEQETRGKPFVMLFAHESQKAVIDYLNGLSGHGVASVLNDGREVIGREAAGGFVPLFMTMGQLTSSNGYCAVIRDITQWKRTEDELRNAKGAAETANAHKTDFLARVSHEIRTPLNAIIGFSDMMAGERFGPIGHPRYIEYANDIGRSGRHVLDIVNDLLDISKIEAGEMDLDFDAVGLNEAVSEAVALIQPQANGQRVIIRTALSQSVPDVVADLRSIKQIALNILSNAIRFTPSGGQIVVSTSYEANGSVVLRVRDTGIGMTRSELDQAMKPFRQVSSTQSRHRGDGTGLGLPLTKAMVDANRATFSINSTPNEGTLVEITFPSQRVLAG
ncbi:PAS domain S-box protein, partial [Rhizobium leguminosarum bv. viciae]